MANAHRMIQRIEAVLLPLRDEQRALSMKAYLRNQFEFLGIPADRRREACSFLKGEDVSLVWAWVERLWERREREYQYVAMDCLFVNKALFDSHDLSRVKALLQASSWWDTVDVLASWIGAVVRQDRSAQETMDQWIHDPDFWIRRVAMIHQLRWRLDTDKERLGRYAEILAPENEFFIRKAIGWALRDYARWNPHFVAQFMKQKKVLFSRLTIREATKNLTIQQ